MVRLAGILFGTVALLLTGALAIHAQSATPAIGSAAFTQDDFFQPARIWTAKFSFTPDAYQTMQPYSAPDPVGSDFWLRGAEGSRNGVASARGLAVDYVRGAIDIDGRAFTDVGVRYKGNGTLIEVRSHGVSQKLWEKVSLKVDLNKFVKGQKLAGLTTINFHNEVTDASWMNESLSYRLFRDAGVPGPRTSYARVYLTVPGRADQTYLGLYGVVENIDRNFAMDRFGTRDGAILKPVTDKLFTDLGKDWAAYGQTYDPKTDLTPAQKQRVIDFCQLVSYASDADFAANVASYIDIDNFARYLAVVSWSGNPDSILTNGHNFYVYMSPAGKMSFVPWDQDHAFGTFNPGRISNMTRPWSTSVRFFSRMFAVSAVSTAYFARLDEFARTIFRGDRFAPQIDAIAPIIRPSIADEQTDQLARFDSAVAGQPYTRGNGLTVVPLKAFAGARTDELLRQLAQRADY